MKNILTNLITSAVLLYGIVGSLEAQIVRMQAMVPFAWQVNGQQQHAGEYMLMRRADSPVIRIAARTDNKGIYLIVTPATQQDPAGHLVFHRIGNQYFLSAVFAPGPAVSKLRVTAAEKEALQSQESPEISTIFVDFKPVVD